MSWPFGRRVDSCACLPVLLPWSGWVLWLFVFPVCFHAIKSATQDCVGLNYIDFQCDSYWNNLSWNRWWKTVKVGSSTGKHKLFQQLNSDSLLLLFLLAFGYTMKSIHLWKVIQKLNIILSVKGKSNSTQLSIGHSQYGFYGSLLACLQVMQFYEYNQFGN